MRVGAAPRPSTSLSIRHASARRPDDVCLTFGYNTGDLQRRCQRAARHPQRHQHGRDGVDPARWGLAQAGHPAGQRAVRRPRRQRADRRPPGDRDLPARHFGVRPRSPRSPTVPTRSIDAHDRPRRRARADARRLRHDDLPPDPRELDAWRSSGLVAAPRVACRLVVLGHYQPTTIPTTQRCRRPPATRSASSVRSTTRTRAVAAIPLRALPPRAHRRRHQPVAGRGDGRRQRRRRPSTTSTTRGWPATARSTSPTPTSSTRCSPRSSTTRRADADWAQRARERFAERVHLGAHRRPVRTGAAAASMALAGSTTSRPGRSR